LRTRLGYLLQRLRERSKTDKYLSHPEGFKGLEEDFKQQRISRATYFRAKKKMGRLF